MDVTHTPGRHVSRVTAERALELTQRALAAAGAPREPAAVQAEWLVDAELRGHPSHGLQRVPVLVERMRNGVLDPAAVPELTWRSEAALRVDGRHGFGPTTGRAAMAALSARARAGGVAVAAIRNAGHLGVLAPYVEAAAADGLIAVALTTSEALVHPWGGSAAMIGTNPIAVGVPAEPAPFVLDMATGAVSMGRILDHRRRGEPLEPGWAVDGEGRPTLDPDAAAVVAPFGGAKGYALGVALELLVGCLSGTALGRDVAGTLDGDLRSTKGDLFLCFDPAAFGAPSPAAAASAYLRALRETEPQPGSAGVLIPGDRARAERARRLVDGFDVTDELWHELEALAA